MKIRLKKFKVVKSTNDIAIKLIKKKIKEPTLITSRKQTTNFFSKWFHTVGYSSILYDVILLVAIYIIYLYLNKLITSN